MSWIKQCWIQVAGIYASVIIISCHVMEQSRGEVVLLDITFLRQNSWMGFVHCILWWQSGNWSHIITLRLWLRLEDKHKNWAEGARGLTKVQADQGQHSSGIWNEHTKYESRGKIFPRESHIPWRVVWTFRVIGSGKSCAIETLLVSLKRFKHGYWFVMRGKFHLERISNLMV